MDSDKDKTRTSIMMKIRIVIRIIRCTIKLIPLHFIVLKRHLIL